MGHKDYCCVPGCGNRREDKSGLSFYSIPLKSHERYQAWLDAIGRGSDWLPTPHTRICSAHFVGGKKSNIPHSASFIPTLSLHLVTDGDIVTPKRRKRRSDNDFKNEMGRLSAKSDEYFRMPPTEVTSLLEVQGLLGVKHPTTKSKVRKGLPFGMSPDTLLHHKDTDIADSLLAKPNDLAQTSFDSGKRSIKKEPHESNINAADVNNSTYVIGLSGGKKAVVTSTSNSKTSTVYPIGTHVQLNVPNPAASFSRQIAARPAQMTVPAKSLVTTSIPVQPNQVVAGHFGGDFTATILTPTGYKTVAQLLHEKRVVTNPDQSICKIESIAGGAKIVDVEKLLAEHRVKEAALRAPVSTTWKDVTHMEKIFKDLDKFWKQKLYTDVMIKVEDHEETIEAHKLVVAACSPYLTSLLANLPDAVITIHLPVKKEAMKCILTYMYSGLLKLEDTSVHDVVQTAKLLKMTKVRMLCEKFIEQHKIIKRVPSNFNLPLAKMMVDEAKKAVPEMQSKRGRPAKSLESVPKLRKLAKSMDGTVLDSNDREAKGSQEAYDDDNLVIDENGDENGEDGDDGEMNGDGDDEAMDVQESADEMLPASDANKEESDDDGATGSQDYENLDSLLDQIQADEVKSDGAGVGDFISKLLNVHDEIKKESPKPGHPDMDEEVSNEEDSLDAPPEVLKSKGSHNRSGGPFSHLCSICGWRFPSEMTCLKHIETRHADEVGGNEPSDFVQHGRSLIKRNQGNVYGMTEEENELNDSKGMDVMKAEDDKGLDVGSLDGIATTISSGSGKPRLSYVCCYCASKYPTMELCRQHTITCDNKFKMLGLPKDIVEEKDQGRKSKGKVMRMHECPECEFTTANRRYMPFHLYYKHDQPLPEELSKINCTKCNRMFPSKQALSEHAIVHTGMAEGGHNCKICGKSFKYSSSLRGHIQHKHTKEKIYACPKCPHRSKTITQHKVHLMTHYDREKTFPCPHCVYHAVTRKNLDVHVSQKHADGVADGITAVADGIAAVADGITAVADADALVASE